MNTRLLRALFHGEILYEFVAHVLFRVNLVSGPVDYLTMSDLGSRKALTLII